MVQAFGALMEKARGMEKGTTEFLAELVQFKTIAPREEEALRACAGLIDREFKNRGYRSSLYVKNGAPIVYASKDVGAKKTLLFYHHYDVQPAGDHGLWKSSPWELAARDGKLYGRGVSDDKGPLVASIAGVEIVEEILGKVPVNIRFVVEGEEEAGSMSLQDFTRDHADFITADGSVWEGVSATPGSPGEVVCGLKGDAYFELVTKGPPDFAKTDAHSGEAGAVPNAAWRLTWALSTLKAPDERITIDGFHELVRKPLEEDIEALREYQGDITSQIMHEYGLERPLMGRKNLELLEELFLRPQISICGVTTGYQGVEDMTVVPAKASAKLDVRMVPDLTVDKVHALLRKHLDVRGFTDIEVVKKPGLEPAKTPVSHPYIKLVHSIMKEVCAPAGTGVVPMAQYSGPADMFAKHAPLCMAYCYADTEETFTHAPNENMKVASMRGSIALVAAITERMGLSNR